MDGIIAVGFTLGAILGSFLNALVYRLPRGLSLWNPKRSFCPVCKHPLGIKDLIPIISYFFLRGKCRYCKQRVSFHYPLLELLMGGFGMALAWRLWAQETSLLRFFLSLLFITFLVAIFVIDLEWFVIPDSLNAALFLNGIALSFLSSKGVFESLLGAWTGLGVLWVVALLGRLVFRKDAMGHGDMKMSRGIGAVFLTGGVLLSLILAIFIGATVGLFLIMRTRQSGNVQVDSPGDVQEKLLEPESISSLIRSGIGYASGIDLLAFLFPKVEVWWFGPIEEMDPSQVAKPTLAPGALPFGPSIAASAMIVLFFEQEILLALNAYFAGTGLSFT